MSFFEASVQYNDFEGTVAADRADAVSMRDFLIAEGIAKDSERVVGYRIALGENHGHEVESPGIVIYLQEGSFDDPSRVVRAVEISMTTAKFFSFFKRFDLVMMQKDLKLEGVEVDGPHYY